MPDGFLDEPPVNAVLGQVGHPRVPQAMWCQRRWQAQRVAVGGEPRVDLRRADPPAPLGHPQCRMIVAAELGPDVLGVVGHGLDRPAHDRRHVAPPGRLPAHRLAVADVQHAVPAELWRGRVAAPVGQIQLRGLGAAQPPPVDDLEQRRVAVGGQCPLPPRRHCPLDLLVGVIKESLQLAAGERPCLRAALVVVQVRDGVPLVADRHGVHARAERLLACRRPAITGVAQVLAEQPQLGLVAADRRRSQVTLAGQRQRPVLDVPRSPVPRVLVREGDERTDQPLPRRDRGVPQPAGLLLRPPPVQHRLDHRVLRTQLHHAGDQFQVRRPGQLAPSQPGLQRQKPQPSEGRIMHPAGSACNSCRSAAPAASLLRLLRDPAYQATSANDPA